MTRLDYLPQPDVEERQATERQLAINGIRRRLSLIAGRLTQNQGTVERCIMEVEVELQRLRAVKEQRR